MVRNFMKSMLGGSKTCDESVPQEAALKKQDIFVIVSTTDAVLLVNLNTKNVLPLRGREGWLRGYYGISWFPEGEDLVIAQTQSESQDYFIDLEFSEAIQESGFITWGKCSTEPCLSAPHQIFCASDNRVVCVNTGRNAISVFSLTNPSFVQEKRLSSARWDRSPSGRSLGDHLNSVFEKDGLLYVIAHGHGYEKGSSLAILTYPDLEMVSLKQIKGRCALHNIWVTKEKQYISCSSLTGELIELTNTDNVSVLWRSGFGSFLRGLAGTDKFVLVGESQMVSRENRSASASGLWMLDRETWQVIDYFNLGPYGNVHEVRLLNVPDEAHHGYCFKGFEKMLQETQGALDATTVEYKISMSNQYNDFMRKWKNLKLIYGFPSLERGTELVASKAAEVCLLTFSDSPESVSYELIFNYSLDLITDAHVSVVSYRGRGDDAHMQAMLLRKSEPENSILSLWNNDGETWREQAATIVMSLPTRGAIRIFSNAEDTKYYINEQLIMTFSKEQFSLENGKLGIRWCGSRIQVNSCHFQKTAAMAGGW